jgi:magnesium-transporting ATPase (P-type)
MKKDWMPLNNVWISVMTAILISLLVNVFTSPFGNWIYWCIVIIILIISAIILSLYEKKKTQVDRSIEKIIKEKGAINPGDIDRIKRDEYPTFKRSMRWMLSLFCFFSVSAIIIVSVLRYCDSVKEDIKTKNIIEISKTLELMSVDIGNLKRIDKEKLIYFEDELSKIENRVIEIIKKLDLLMKKKYE